MSEMVGRIYEIPWIMLSYANTRIRHFLRTCASPCRFHGLDWRPMVTKYLGEDVIGEVSTQCTITILADQCAHPHPSAAFFRTIYVRETTELCSPCATRGAVVRYREERLLQDIVDEVLVQDVWTTRGRWLRGQELVEGRLGMQLTVTTGCRARSVSGLSVLLRLCSRKCSRSANECADCSYHVRPIFSHRYCFRYR
ncbi:hypothetical protein EDB87DRAFT_207853 [Lactarius vividus]|nr:hypothetical protein EDB87DRAFT_207853 [Lactarius vividus]